MSKSGPISLLPLPVRWRLTAWYLVSLVVVLVLFSAFTFWQVRRGLLSEVDAGLRLAATQALTNIDVQNGHFAFQNVENVPHLSDRLGDNATILILSSQGEIRDSLGQTAEIPRQAPRAGLYTLSSGENAWRVYGEQLAAVNGSTPDWLVVVQSMQSVRYTLRRLSFQLLWGLPVALGLAAIGGYFLAGRALSPIDKITWTARSINASDLNRRIAYTGADDELGRLATTFDEMLDRLQAAFETERRFTADAAHELRTPLAALKGRIEVTLARTRETGEYVDTLFEMEQQVDRLIRLSNDLLLIARLDQAHLQPNPEPVRLDDLLAAIIDQVLPMAQEKSITVRADTTSAGTIYGDVDLLIRLFLNLLDNAIKYTPARGHVFLTTSRDAFQVTVSVRDTGPGMSSEHLAHLFERFYRVQPDRARHTRSHTAGGAGLESRGGRRAAAEGT